MDVGKYSPYAAAALAFAQRAALGIGNTVKKAEGKSPALKAVNEWLRRRTPTQSFFIITANEVAGLFTYPLYAYLIYEKGWKGAAINAGIWWARHVAKGYAYPFLMLSARKSQQYRRMIHLTQKKGHTFWHATARTVLRTAFGSAAYRKNRKRYTISRDWVLREKRFLAIQAAIQSTWLLPLALPKGWIYPAYAAVTIITAPYTAANLHRILRRNGTYRHVARRGCSITYRYGHYARYVPVIA